MVENVVDAERDRRLIEQISPRRPTIVKPIRPAAWRFRSEFIRRLHIEEPRLLDAMDVVDEVAGQVIRPVLVKTVPVMRSEDRVKAVPVPAQLGKPLPFEIRVLGKWIRRGAAQLLFGLTREE